MSPLLRNILITLGLAVVAWLGYVVFFKDDTPPVTEAQSMNQAIRDGQEFLMRVRQLDQITLKGDILMDQRFTSLINFSVEPEEEGVGRDNPFEPIPGLAE